MKILSSLALLLSLASCALGSQILDVGKPCSSDDDCSPETECVRSDSANASSVCMPIDQSADQGE